MDENSNLNPKLLKVGIVIAAILALIALAIGFIFPLGGGQSNTRSLTYDQIEPFVKDYLIKNNIVGSNGMVKAPDAGDDVSEVTIEQVIDQLIAIGKFDYLKGDTGAAGVRGQNGATGATGARGEQGIPGSAVAKGDKGDKGDRGDTGAAGTNGTDGTDGVDGLITATDGSFVVSGGTLSLKPCALDEVLMSNGTTWSCATVTSSGVDNDTTNVSATLTLNGTSLEASITDSDGNTINTPPIDLGSTFATDLELSNAITTAVNGLNLAQYAKQADITDAIDALNIEDYAKSTDVSSAIATATANLVSQTDLTSAISALNLSQYATSGQLSALSSRVTTLEGTSSDHEGRITALETGSASGYVTDSELTTTLSGYYTKSQTYSQTEVDSEIDTKVQTATNNLQTNIDNKQDKLPNCSDGQVVKYNTTTLTWECASDLNNVSGDGSNFATENWVTNHVSTYVASQNFATTSALNTLSSTVSGLSTDLSSLDTRVATIEGAGYVTTTTLNTTLSSYLKTTDLSAEMYSRLVAGSGINLNTSSGTITITSTAQTDVFELTSDHATITTPDPNKIYIDTGTNPASQWVYENSVWTQVGEVNVDMAGYYTKTQTDNVVASAINANNAGYTTTTELTTLLNNKADKTALDATNTNLNTTNSNLATTNTNLQTAQQDITNLENNLSNNYTTTSALTPMLAAKQDKLPACADGEVVKYTIATNSWACGTDNNTSTDLSGYAKTTDMNTAIASAISTNNNNYTTTTDLNTLLNNKADKTALDATNTALATETSNRTAGDTALDGRLDTIEADYLKSSDMTGYVTTSQISDMATKTWVQGQQYLTAAAADLAGYAKQSWVTGQSYVTSTTLTTTLANYTTDSELTTATSDMATNSGVASGYVPKSSLNCNSSQAMLGTATNGTISCRAIQDIATGSMVNNNNLITANTLATVLGNYYTKTQMDTMLMNYVRAGGIDVSQLATKSILDIAKTTASPSEIMLYYADQLTDLPSDWRSGYTNGFLKIEMARSGNTGVSNNRRITLSAGYGAVWVRHTYDGVNGSWAGDWSRLDNSITAIAASTDLNNIKTAGTYSAMGSALVPTLVNTPPTTASFTLLVQCGVAGSTPSACTQTAISVSDGSLPNTVGMWYRGWNTANWSGWIRVDNAGGNYTLNTEVATGNTLYDGRMIYKYTFVYNMTAPLAANATLIIGTIPTGSRTWVNSELTVNGQTWAFGAYRDNNSNVILQNLASIPAGNAGLQIVATIYYTKQ